MGSARTLCSPTPLKAGFGSAGTVLNLGDGGTGPRNEAGATAVPLDSLPVYLPTTILCPAHSGSPAAPPAPAFAH